MQGCSSQSDCVSLEHYQAKPGEGGNSLFPKTVSRTLREWVESAVVVILESWIVKPTFRVEGVGFSKILGGSVDGGLRDVNGGLFLD